MIWPELVAALVGGGVVAEAIRLVVARPGRVVAVTQQLQQIWEDELARLHAEVNRLRALVTILEEEIVALGGDPRRIAGKLARRYPDTE